MLAGGRLFGEKALLTVFSVAAVTNILLEYQHLSYAPILCLTRGFCVSGKRKKGEGLRENSPTKYGIKTYLPVFGPHCSSSLTMAQGILAGSHTSGRKRLYHALIQLF
jgi:hypothetical protein